MRNKLSYFFALLARFYLFPLYLISGLVPRKKNLWVFGSWGGLRFADNTAAFFLHCETHNAADTDHVWISRRREIVSLLRKRGFKAYLIWSPLGMYCCARASVFLFDCFSKDINFWLSKNAIRVNLWSGVPLKTFERDIDKPNNRYYRLFHGSLPERLILSFLMPWHVNRLDLLIATSPVGQNIVCSAFGVPEERVLISGYPRTDVFFEPVASLAAVLGTTSARVQAALDAGKKIFIFLPTFRDDGKPYLQIDWEKLNQFLSENNAIFCYKFHVVDQTKMEYDNENVVALPDDCDLYSILLITDCLISDYSSVIFDYLLLRRPVIYNIPDHEKFMTTGRKLNFDYDEISVGPQCRTFNELLHAMGEVTSQKEEVVTKRHLAVEKMMHVHLDGNASQRILKQVKQRLAEY